MIKSIGFDLDDCVFVTSKHIHELAVERKIIPNMEFREVNTYDLEKAYSVEPEVIEVIVQEVIHSNELDIMLGASIVLSWVESIYEPIHFITDRPTSCIEATHNQLSKLNLECEYKLHIESKIDKARIIDENNIDIFVEDKPSNIYNICENTRARVLVYDQPWNQDIVDGYEITIVRNWMEIREFLMLQ